MRKISALDVSAEPTSHPAGSPLAALEARIAALEQRPPQLTYTGIWDGSIEYSPGQVVTHSGSMFYCWALTRSKPGESNSWQLCVKRGRDAR